jgi:hypothetical protein
MPLAAASILPPSTPSTPRMFLKTLGEPGALGGWPITKSAESATKNA